MARERQQQRKAKKKRILQMPVPFILMMIDDGQFGVIEI